MDTGDDEPVNLLQFTRKSASSLNYLSLHILYTFLVSINVSLLVKTGCIEHLHHFNIAFMGKSVQTYVDFNNVTGPATIYDLISEDKRILE